MDPVVEATFIPGEGMQGSVGRSRRRQVTLLERELWETSLAELGVTRAPVMRRANMLVSGVSLANTRGRVLRVGAVRLAIGGELTPCERMDEAAPGLQAILRSEWRGGAFAQVLTGGIVRVGDAIEWEVEAPGSSDTPSA
jgi:MOSC domain-containing protein YiiM